MASPYLLPEGKVQIAFSGGRTSAYMLHQILQANGGLPAEAMVSFQNTGREMPQTLDFVQECSTQWNVPVVWLEYRAEAPKFEVVNHNSASRNGEPFAALVAKRKSLPNRVARFCTAELKVHCATRYARSIGWERWHNCVGIRADEPGRLSGQPAKERWRHWRPLVAAGVSRLDVAEFWRRQPFDLRLANINGRTPLGNCDGCFLKSEANRAHLAKEHPERFAWWVEMERRVGSTFKPAERYADLADYVARQTIMFDEAAEYCQADDGECTG